MQDFTDATKTFFGSLQLEAESALLLVKVAMREYCFMENTSFSEVKDLHDLKMGSALHQNVNLVLADPPHSTRSTPGQAISS